MPPRIQPQPRGGAGPQIQQHVTTIGVRRPAWGSSGRAVNVHTNHFEVKIPQGTIHHYDMIGPSDKNLPAKLNLELIKRLQDGRPDVFTPKAVYDGRKNLFAVKELPLRNRDDKGQAAEEFKVTLSEGGNPQSSGKPPKEYKIRLTKVAQINPEVLHGFLQGRQSHDSAVLTAITALNVVIRMLPISKYPFNVRSFFTDRETKEIGGGLVLWRGYFQSVRPGGNRMWINIDISTGTMYKSGPLIRLCLDHLERNQVQDLVPHPQGGFGERDRIRLQRFIAGIRIVTIHTQGHTPRVIKKVTGQGAAQLMFQTREGGSMSVAQYFRTTYRKNLDHPNLPCVEVGSGALLPLELCMVPPGQIMRKQVPPEKTKDVLAFSTQKPHARLASIRNAIDVFEYGPSEYLRSFGMQVNTAAGPLSVPARILEPPSLKYGRGSRQPTIKPDNGTWNMRDKKFYRPSSIKGWIMVIFERQGRFGEQQGRSVAKALSDACNAVGILGMDPNPIMSHLNAQGNIRQQMVNAGLNWKAKFGGNKELPQLVVAILPENATDLYTAVKHFGDCLAGVSTQCLKALKCSRGSAQYFANVCLKINVKLGGINCVPLAQDVPVLTDPTNPTIVLGADVIHPPPGSGGRPSFTALVGNVDSENSKYVAKTSVQESRVEMIQDLRPMTKAVVEMFQMYRKQVEQNNTAPKKVIFYRDGVSEGQFKTVLDEEVPQIKGMDVSCAIAVNLLTYTPAALEDLGLKGASRPKITVIVVGKRHHVRFFPSSSNKTDSDQSGNCRAGTVVDREISHPTEFDFYLQSHAGLLGTSRPAHYNVLLDENKFTPDSLQQLSFALCHVYARSTRSVSIPAPVYYADIVCSRAKNHFDPGGNIEFESHTLSDGQPHSIEAYKRAYKPTHTTTARSMYFS